MAYSSSTHSGVFGPQTVDALAGGEARQQRGGEALGVRQQGPEGPAPLRAAVGKASTSESAPGQRAAASRSASPIVRWHRGWSRCAGNRDSSSWTRYMRSSPPGRTAADPLGADYASFGRNLPAPPNRESAGASAASGPLEKAARAVGNDQNATLSEKRTL